MAALLLAAGPAVASANLDRATAWFAGLPDGDPIRFFDGAPPAHKVRLEGVTRNAVGARNRQALTSSIPPRASMEIAFAALCLPPETPCPGTSVFTVTATTEAGEARTIYSKTLAEKDTRRWHIAAVDLAPLVGDEVVLGFTTSSSPEADSSQRLLMWGEPRIMRDESSAGPNVILISIDTLRADRLGCYGHDRDTSPNLDRLARNSVRFANAISQAPWTTPSHTSMLTSLHPSSHKVNTELGELGSGSAAEFRYLSPRLTTLAEILRERGYATSAITGSGTISGAWGFDQGFDHFEEFVRTKVISAFNPGRESALPNFRRVVGERLDAMRDNRFFLFVHTFEVHAPYIHHEFARPFLTDRQASELAVLVGPGHTAEVNDRLRDYLIKENLDRVEVTSAMYDGGIRFVDEQLIAPLLSELAARGLAERTILVFTSDHGEEFGEHDPNRIYGAHGITLWDTLLHVPLIVRVPGRFESGRVVEQQVRVIDIAPTILDLLDIATDPAMEGASLVPMMAGQDASVGPAISEATVQGPEWKSIRTDRHKLIDVLSSESFTTWWQVDLGSTREIDRIRIWNRSDCCRERLSNYWLVASSSAAPTLGKGDVFRRFQRQSAGLPTEIQVGKSARYIRIGREDRGILALAEVEVLEQGTGANLALLGTATQSSTHKNAIAGRAIDGNTDGFFGHRSVSHTEKGGKSEVDRTGMQTSPLHEMLFDLSTDPGEQVDISRQQQDKTDELSRALRRNLEAFAAKEFGTAAPRPIDDDVRERLRALGYID